MLIQTLNVADRQVILVIPRGMDAASIAEITGLSSPAIATKIHRIKNILLADFMKEDAMAGRVFTG